MKQFLPTLLITITCFLGNAQNSDIEGKWYVKDKQSKSDFDVPERFYLVKDSTVFDSKSMVDSMYCIEYLLLEPDSNFTCVGECKAYDPANYWFSSYGSYGNWTTKNNSILKLDYIHGLFITHAEFKIRRRKNQLVLTRTKMETVEIKVEKESEN